MDLIGHNRMALTVVKYRKSASGETTATPTILVKSKMQTSTKQQSVLDVSKKPFIKLQEGSGLVINKIPAVIKPTMKRTYASTEPFKSPKYALQTIASAGTPLTSFQWQQTIGGSTNATSATKKQQQLGAAISSLPPNTIIKATTAPTNALQTSNGNPSLLTTNSSASSASSASSTVQVRRPTIYIKREVPKQRTIRTITLELIEKNPQIHLGLQPNRLPLIKNDVCTAANITLVDCYLTLKKLKQNEDFSLLAEYFEMTEGEVQQIFARTVVKLSRYLRYLIRWPDSKKYYDRHKNLPFSFRKNLSHVQSLIECVETDMPTSPLQIDCTNYKFILSINTNGIISYISEAYVGHHDDLTIFNVSNFKNVIPKYLSLVADPGKAIRRKRKAKSSVRSNVQQQHNNGETDSTTDSADESADDLIQTDESEEGRLSKYTTSRVAGELASHQSLSVVNSELTSRRVKNFSIPTMRVRDTVCRLQIRHMINCLHEFKILQPLAIQEPLIYQYLNEILIICGALINLQIR